MRLEDVIVPRAGGAAGPPGQKKGMKRDIRIALDVMGDMVFSPLFEDLDSEREVVLEEVPARLHGHPVLPVRGHEALTTGEPLTFHIDSITE